MDNINFEKLIKSSIEDHNKSFSYVFSEKFAINFEESVKIIWETLNKKDVYLLAVMEDLSLMHNILQQN